MRTLHRTSAGGPCPPVILGLLVTCGLVTVGCRPSQPLNVLLVTFDTTRADHIGCYGRDDVQTPAVDGLAARGVRFAKAYSAIPLTTPSHSTILTGKYPIAHGVRDNGQFVLPEQQDTLAEILKREGYSTAAAIGAFPLTRQFGTDQGFDFYDDKVAKTEGAPFGERVLPKQSLFFDERKAGRVNEALLPWLEANHSRPFFVWAHYFDPHQPFEPPPPHDQLYAQDGYLGEIAYADESLGRLLEALRELGVDDRTVIVFVSDHGEGRDEHNELTHSLQLYDTTLHVPLIIAAPSGPSGLTIETPVATVDILPTILDILGIDVAQEVQGISLLPLMKGETREGPSQIYAETLAPRLGFRWGELRALIKGDLKYIHGPRPELYDVTADPRELNDLAISRAEIAASMHEELAQFLADNSDPDIDAAVTMDEATRQQLMALGYLSGSGEDASSIEEVLRSGGVAPQDRVKDISDFSHAKNMLYERRPLPARELIQQLVDRDPENPVYLELLAAAYTQLGQLDEALGLLENTAQEGKISGKLLLQIGALYFFRGEYEIAEETLLRSLELEEGPVGSYLLANVYMAEGDRDAEVEALAAALAADPSYAPARVDLAIRLAQRGSKEEAESEFQRAIRDQPYFAKAYFNYGAFLAGDGFLSEAAEHLDRALVINPDYRRATVALIQVQLARGKREEAREAFETLAARAPGSPETEQARSLIEDGT